MLPYKNRLKNRSAFKATYRLGKSFRQDGITMVVGKNKTSEEYATKIGFVVSKKIHKRAVKRNRIKRLMRENIRLLLKKNKINTNAMSIVFIASTKLLDKNFNDIKNTMTHLVGLL